MTLVTMGLLNVPDLSSFSFRFSDASLEGGTPQLLISKPTTLDLGNKTYQVQMKTSLKYQAFLDQSRLHVIIN